MQTFIDIINILSLIRTISSRWEESWGYANFSGQWNPEFFLKLKELEGVCTKNQCIGIIKIRLDEDHSDLTEVYDYNVAGSFSTWEININKETLINQNFDGVYYNFFLESLNFENWITKINTFSEDCPLNNQNRQIIIIENLEMPFGGPLLTFLPADIKYINIKYTSIEILPEDSQVKEKIHFITNFKPSVHLKKYQLSDGDLGGSLAKKMLNISSCIFASTITNEFYSDQKVIVDGLKRVELKLTDNEDCTFGFHTTLSRLVSWLYQDRVQTRKKLFADRVTLELNAMDTMLSVLIRTIDVAFEQAKERFNFVILDRKDAYVKELKDLLKDLRGQSDLYSVKIRGLMSSLLRDVLAGIILIGFTIFTKFTDNIQLDKNQLLKYVFIGLAIYYVLSLLIQVIIDVTDILVTEKELKYWKNVTKELIPDSEFEMHRVNSLKNRRRSFLVIYIVIAVLYFAIATACYYYPELIHRLVEK